RSAPRWSARRRGSPSARARCCGEKAMAAVVAVAVAVGGGGGGAGGGRRGAPRRQRGGPRPPPPGRPDAEKNEAKPPPPRRAAHAPVKQRIKQVASGVRGGRRRGLHLRELARSRVAASLRRSLARDK